MRNGQPANPLDGQDGENNGGKKGGNQNQIQQQEHAGYRQRPASDRQLLDAFEPVQDHRILVLGPRIKGQSGGHQQDGQEQACPAQIRRAHRGKRLLQMPVTRLAAAKTIITKYTAVHARIAK